MSDYLKLSELDDRFQKLLLINSTAYGHFDQTRRYQLLNDAQYEVFKLLIESYDEIYFVAVKDGITPGADGTEINLETALDPNKPFYRVIAFEKQVGSLWRPVTLTGPRDAWRKSASLPETWYVIGRKFKTDTASTGTYRICYHYRIPKLVNAGDECEIPPEFAEMVPIFGAKVAALQARQKDDAVFFDGEIERRKQEMKKFAANRIMARQMSVMDVEGYGDGNRPAPGVYIIT